MDKRLISFLLFCLCVTFFFCRENAKQEKAKAQEKNPPPAAVKISDKSTPPDTQKTSSDTIKVAHPAQSKQPKLPVTYFKGKPVWVKQLSVKGEVNSTMSMTDKAGNFIVQLSVDGTVRTGSGLTFKGKENPLILIYSKEGQLIWSKLFSTLNANHVSFDFSDSIFTAEEYDGIHKMKYYYVSKTGKLLPRKPPKDPIPNSADSRFYRFWDKEGNIIVAGAERIKTEIQQPDDISYTATVRSIPMVAKYSPAGKLLWKLACTKNCVGDIDNFDLDTAGNIWVRGTYRGCDAQPCFNLKATETVDYQYDFTAKISPSGKLLLSSPGRLHKQEEAHYMKVTPQGHVIIHNGTSCFKYETTTNPPYRVYDLNFNLLWENCLADVPGARLDCMIIEQPHQTVIAGEKRTGMIQPGETKQDFLDKQAIVFMRLNTKGKTVWSKREKTTLGIASFLEGPAPNFYLLGYSRPAAKIGNKTYSPKSEFSYFVICYQ
jgi:hypothetical protein